MEDIRSHWELGGGNGKREATWNNEGDDKSLSPYKKLLLVFFLREADFHSHGGFEIQI